MTCTAGEPRIVYRGSVEFVDIDVTSALELDTQEVFFSFVPHPYAWLSAEWEGDPGTMRTASILGDDANLPAKSAEVFVKVVDVSTAPIMSAGMLHRA